MPQAGPAWQAVLDQIGADGSVSKATALPYYTQLAQEMIGEIGARLTSPVNFGLTIEARVGLPVSAKAWAETSVLTASGEYVGKPERCSIVVSPTGDALGDVDARLMMAHEAWHCYQGAILGLQRVWFNPPAPWITEGEAEWVGDSIVPEAPVASGAWPGYLPRPDRPLFGQAYSSVGFYWQLDSSGTDVWGKLVPILEAKDSPLAFVAAGADSDAFLDRWASGFLRDPSRGDPWEITGPAVTNDKAIPTGIHLSNDGSISESVPVYAEEIGVFAETPDVLVATFTGHARLSDSAGHDYLVGEGGNFCMLDTGCVCPEAQGEPPPLPLEGDMVALAVTGGPTGASGTLDGVSLKDFCSGKLAGTWVGTWVNDIIYRDPPATGGFTLHLTQKGNSFSGPVDVTGETCVRQGTASGTVTGHDVQMGWISDVASPVSFVGTINGSTMSGTYSAIACGTTDFTVTGTWQAQRQK